MKHWLLRVHVQDKNDFHVLVTHRSLTLDFDVDKYVKNNFPDNCKLKRLSELTKEEYEVMRKYHI